MKRVQSKQVVYQYICWRCYLVNAFEPKRAGVRELLFGMPWRKRVAPQPPTPTIYVE